MSGVASVATSPQRTASEALPQHSETSTLIVVQPEPPRAQLRLQHAILLAKERDHIALLRLEPRQQRRQQHLQRNHPYTLPIPSLCGVFGQYGLRSGCFEFTPADSNV